MASDVPAVTTAVRILERIAAEWPDPVSPGALINELNLNRSTCYNVLSTLQRAGWAVRLSEPSGWTLGAKLLTLPGTVDELITSAARSELDALAHRLGYVVFIVEPAGDGGYVVVAKADGRTGVRVTVDIGDSFPFSAPAIMHAFCAWLPPDEFDQRADRFGVERFTDHTVTERSELHRVLEGTRSSGFSRSLQQFNLAQSGAAAPIFDHNGRVRSVLCSLAFSSELTKDNIEEVGELIRSCAVRITERIDGTLPRRRYEALTEQG